MVDDFFVEAEIGRERDRSLMTFKTSLMFVGVGGIALIPQ